MKHFFANFIAMFFISKKLRRRIRTKIMGEKPIIQPVKNDDNNALNDALTIKQNQLSQTEQQINEKLQALDNLENKYNYKYLKSEWLMHNNGKLLLPGRFKEYDLIFSIGSSCHPTTMLMFFELRRFSTPFDWTGGEMPENWYQQPDIHRDTRFREKISAICNNFQDWLTPEYFKYVCSSRKLEALHHHVVNTKTHIRYAHEFPANQDIMQHMPEFVEKTQRRIKNLYAAIDKSKHILVIWMASIWDQRTILEQPVSDKDIKWAVKQMQKMYPNKEFDFVFFEPDGNQGKFEYERIMITSNACRIRSNHFFINNEYNFVHPAHENQPHIHVISEMLDNIHLSKNAFKLPDSCEV
ncbi:MAG: hypothetical protein IJQ55_01950 [Alphaproteobacteria bacterium]|nr:hypothetical protein [Alphaproteobacteria bacterium]